MEANADPAHVWYPCPVVACKRTVCLTIQVRVKANLTAEATVELGPLKEHLQKSHPELIEDFRDFGRDVPMPHRPLAP